MNTNSMWHPGIPVDYRDRVVCGDARVLSEGIPDNSIDLIFTDPVYDQIEDYEWLTKLGNRTLTPNGALLCFCSIGLQHETQLAIARSGGMVKWIFPIVYLAGHSPRFHPLGFCKWTMLLWVRGEPIKSFCDAQLSTFEGSTNSHKWTKNTKPLASYLEAFSQPGAVVFDPFTGGGTIPTICKQLGRHYIAFEIDPTTAHNAQHRIDNTQPPLFVLNDEQLSLDLE